MKTLLELYESAERDGIRISNFELPQSKSISVTDCDGNCFIGIDTKQIQCESDEKMKLAHELGHCKTGSFYNRYSHIDIVEKHENYANRWAYGTLVPFAALQNAILSGATEIWQLAEYFGVSPEYLQKVLIYYTECKGLKVAQPPQEVVRSSAADDCTYRNALKSKVEHISFSDSDMTIDEMTETDARAVLEAITNSR